MMARDKQTEPDTQSRKENVVNGSDANKAKATSTKKTDKERGYILKLKFASFEKKSVYSVDVHPDGTRFAAGGMGEETNGRLCFYHVLSLRPASSDLNLICQLDTHEGCVNCVRWSGRGDYLASGACDSVVKIWQQTRLGDQENWKPLHTLRGHHADVLAVCWSPGDVWLASSALDNTVVIRDVQKSFEVVHTLREDKGHVKGVVWDPVGKYVATQSDQRICVWRTGDWALQHSSKEFFRNCGGGTQLLRLDWSTDGTCIVTAHATNEGRPVAQMIDRAGIGEGRAEERWNSVNYLAGFSRPVVCVVRGFGRLHVLEMLIGFFLQRFSPKMYISDAKNDTPYCVCVTGSRDHSVCVWVSSDDTREDEFGPSEVFSMSQNFRHARPHLFSGLFSAPVMDVSWFPDGYSFLACSLDGTMAFIHCGKRLTGTAIVKEQQMQCLEKLYGKKLDNVSALVGHNIVESSVFLAAQEAETQRKKDTDAQTSSAPQDTLPRLPYPEIPLDKQIEVILPNGRRRITPVFIPETVVLPGSGLFNGTNPFSVGPDERSQSNSTFSEATRLQSDAVPTPVVQMSRPFAPRALASAVRSNQREIPKKAAPVENGTSSKKQTKAVENAVAAEPRIGVSEAPRKSKKVEVQSREVPPAPVTSSAQQKPKKPPRTDSDSRLDKVLTKPNLYRFEFTDRPSAKTEKFILPRAQPAVAPSATRVESVRRPVQSMSRRMPLPPLLSKLSVSMKQDGSAEAAPLVSLSVENDLAQDSTVLASNSRFHKVQMVAGDRIVWTQFVHSPVILTSANEKVCCAVCSDHSFFVWSSESGAINHKRILSAPGTHLACTKACILIVTSDCKAEIWTRKHPSDFWSRTTLGSLDLMLRGQPGVTISYAGFSTTEVPVVGLSDHRYFICDTSDLTWVIVHDDNIRFGNYLVECGMSSLNGLKGPLSKLQNIRASMSVDRKIASDVSRTLLMNHMENQMLLCKVIKSPSEYQCWLACYARCLVENNNSLRLRSLLDSLMGPLGTKEELEDSGWQPEILGLSRRSLLKDTVLPVLGKNVIFQRLFLEYGQLLQRYESSSLFALE